MDFVYNSEKRTIKLQLSEASLYDYFDMKGYYFSKEILTRYFVSLKTKPFVILTGISGTGKTKIAQIFADYICQDLGEGAKESHIAFIPVRPDWMDNKGILGYYNVLDEKYHASPLLRLLIQAQNTPTKPFFVILDEMNLAKVEHYFSDFLSILESRTPDNPIGEPLILHSMEEVKTVDGLSIPGKLNIPPNVFFTGTVNVDESTYMFSPKVLDRANVIEFNEVNLKGYSTGDTTSTKYYLDDDNVGNQLIEDHEPPFCSRMDFKKYLEISEDAELLLERLLNVLKEDNLHFGYRVVNEISRFLCISQKITHDFNLKDSLDIQILQKVLPKLHGTRARLEEPLNKLFSFCFSDSQLDTFSESDFNKAISFADDVPFPRSAQKLAKMVLNLSNQGYTSFIE